LKAIILAAGRGERMRPLTDHMPKPLVDVGGKPLIVHHLEKLAAIGCERIVVNHAHLGEMIEAALGDGARYGVVIDYSREVIALETAGGIVNALPLLGAEPFIAVNADVYSEFDYAKLRNAAARLGEADAHLVLVDNPEHHPEGDFALQDGILSLEGSRLTFSGLAVYRPALFASIVRGAIAPLAPLLRAQIAAGCVVGEHFGGRWCDVGTPDRLTKLNRELRVRRV
jgi:N-acetyl-alpha-D-muramate 1-phosphate uridylyltransferase